MYEDDNNQSSEITDFDVTFDLPLMNHHKLQKFDYQIFSKKMLNCGSGKSNQRLLRMEFAVTAKNITRLSAHYHQM